MSGLLDVLTEDQRGKARRKAMPGWTAPMLATLTDKRFSDPKWIYERKLDGERCLAFVDGKKIQLKSRNKQSLNTTYPELVDAMKRQTHRFIVDGEIVAFSKGRTSFERLQGRMKLSSEKAARDSNIRVYLYLFDILHVDGHDLTRVPLRARKGLLRRAVDFGRGLRYTRHRNEDGESYYRDACRKGWEGVIAKNAQSTYVHSRSTKWLKFKCVNRQELVIGGYTDPQGKRTGFGALLIGYYERGDLRYAGKVGTGFDRDTLRDLGARLKDLESERCPFSDLDGGGDSRHWVRPKLVAEIGFTEWTREGRLRHPRYIGLRHDKKPKDVHRETPTGG